MHLGLKTGPLCPIFCTKLQELCSFTNFQMAPTTSILMSFSSKKKEPRYLCLSETKASHSPKICTVSSSVPHFLQMGLLLSPITCRCLLKVLCLVSRPKTALDCVLSNDNNWAPVARLGPEINSRACLCVPQGIRHNARCCHCIQCFSRRDTQGQGST